RTCELAPQLGAPVRRACVEQRVDLVLDERPEPFLHRGGAEGASEGRPVARVLGAVAREHARSDDACRGEALVVDRERLGVAHHGDRELAAGDEPAAQRLDPADRPDLREERMRVGLELLERDQRKGLQAQGRASQNAGRSRRDGSNVPTYASCGLVVSRAALASCRAATSFTGYRTRQSPSREPTIRITQGPSPAPTKMCSVQGGECKKSQAPSRRSSPSTIRTHSPCSTRKSSCFDSPCSRTWRRMPSSANSAFGPSKLHSAPDGRSRPPAELSHIASRTFTTNQPSPAGARPDPVSSSFASGTTATLPRRFLAPARRAHRVRGRPAGGDRGLRVARAEVVAGEHDATERPLERRLQPVPSREDVREAVLPAAHDRLFRTGGE